MEQMDYNKKEMNRQLDSGSEQVPVTKNLRLLAITLLAVVLLDQVRGMVYLGSPTIISEISFLLEYFSMDIYNTIFSIIRLVHTCSILIIVFLTLVKKIITPKWITIAALGCSVLLALLGLKNIFIGFMNPIFFIELLLYVILTILFLYFSKPPKNLYFYESQLQAYSKAEANSQPQTEVNSHLQTYLIVNQSKFTKEDFIYLQTVLPQLPEAALQQLYALNLKDPNTILLSSLFLGNIGVDRFILGDTLLGVLKLVTLGGLGVWGILDLFFVGKRAKTINAARVMQLVQLYL